MGDSQSERERRGARLGTRLRAGLSHLRHTTAEAPPTVWDPAWEPGDQRAPTFPGLVSQACTQAQIETDAYQRIALDVNGRVLRHRKQWEWVYIIQALVEGGAVEPGRTGLGFGVGTEPITAYLARAGVRVVATDLPDSDDESAHWSDSNQHASRLADIDPDNICPPEVLERNVSYRPVDMRCIPKDLRDFSFTWSSCALEHLGSLDNGLQFLIDQLDCLRPGGLAVHTTEYNCSSNDETVSTGMNVAYRRRDLEQFATRLRGLGHSIELCFGLGDGEADRHIDVPPWSETHLKTTLGAFVVTSFGLIIRKAPHPPAI